MLCYVLSSYPWLMLIAAYVAFDVHSDLSCSSAGPWLSGGFAICSPSLCLRLCFVCIHVACGAVLVLVILHKQCCQVVDSLSHAGNYTWQTPGCNAGALQVCISRISGICIGVGVSLLISIIIYPSSASVKAMSCLRQVSSLLPLIMPRSTRVHASCLHRHHV